MTDINTHNMRIGFGRHNGELYTRLPVSYIKWMVNIKSNEWETAAAELKRRGTVTPELDVSGHAIDKASLRCRKTWHETREKDEGIYSWLNRMASEALSFGTHDKEKPGRYYYRDMVFVFETDLAWPILKTMMPRKD